MSESALINKSDLVNIPDEEWDILTSQRQDKRLRKLEGKMKDMEDLHIKDSKMKDIRIDEVNNKVDKFKEDIDRKTDVSINNMRLEDQKNDYVTQNDFGAGFRIKIGSVTVGKLFKIVGLAKTSKGCTEPYAELLNSYAICVPIQNGGRNIITYKWHYKICLKKIERWLERNFLTEEFYSIENEKSIIEFINRLYNKYVN